MLVGLIISSSIIRAAMATEQQIPQPRFTAPAFTSSVNARTDLCERQTRVHNGSLALSESLRGLSLSFVFFDDPPFTRLGDDGAITTEGIIVELSDELARRSELTDCGFVLSTKKQTSWGRAQSRKESLNALLLWPLPPTLSDQR